MGMNFSEYRRLDATGLAKLVRDGEVAPEEPLDAAWSRLAQVNPELNAVIADCIDEARKAARARPPGPLGGVPYLIKDLAARMRGLPARAT